MSKEPEWKMSEWERLNRIEALNNAVRHRLREENAEDVVMAAQTYFDFLQGINLSKIEFVPD